jgi:1-acyl-sn-glycerol-3-phosphate acyltransferase
MSATDQRVLAIVRELVAELGGAPRPAATLDAVLDRDLGLSSLERVELVTRLERAFGVSLPETVLVGATTPRDLVSAVSQASPSRVESPGIEVAAEAVSAAGVPDAARTLIEALAWHAARTPDRVHINLRDGEGGEHPITYGQLHSMASGVAAGLREAGVAHGEPVVLMLPTAESFFQAFAGVLTAGAIPVPIYPPVRLDQLADYTRRQRAIVENAGARVLITTSEAERLGSVIRGQVPGLETITTVDSLTSAGSTDGASHGRSEDAALIQYTSGSTGTPKGVLLTHANLLANIRAIGEGLQVRPDDVCVSWLPLYHDMGLIGAWLAPLYYAVPVAIMSPLAFLARPARWLHAVHAHRGTVSPAPNFAFDLVVRKTTDAELEGLDLSSWRLALNGSEMVSPDTIARFTERFAKYGFRPEAMCPVYGLAEASVGLTMTPIGRLPRVDEVEREPFERRRELLPARKDSPHPLRFVSCGRPLPGLEVRVTTADGEVARDREEGRIEFRGSSVTQGYYRDPQATAAVRRGDWMSSGDLGYWSDGDLFITGREKDIIIQAGRNLSAPEIESLVSGVPGIRRGCVAAFGVQDPARGTERLVVIAESRERDTAAHHALQQAITDRLVTHLGVPPDTVVIAPPGAVLKTSSGKIRRNDTRGAYLNGTLGHRHSRGLQTAVLLAGAARDWARRTWRWLGDLLFTARVALAVATTVPGLWLALQVGSSGSTAIRVTRRWARLVISLSGVRLAVTGADRLRSVSRAIVVANHASYVDPLVLMAALPDDLQFVAKKGLTRYPLIGLAITRAGHVTIERDDLTRRLEGAGDLTTRLGAPGTVVVFPEGTFQRRRGLLPFKLGAFKAAVDTGRAVVPVAIRGTRDFWRDGARLLHRVPLEVAVCEPLHPGRQDLSEVVRLRDAARRSLAREAAEPES